MAHNSHSGTEKRFSKLFVFIQLQSSAQLIEIKRYQHPCFHTRAHSSSVSPVVATHTQNIPGVWVSHAVYCQPGGTPNRGFGTKVDLSSNRRGGARRQRVPESSSQTTQNA
jgi:hypothetical protein